MNKNREEGRGKREEVSEAERLEAATEEPATVGCPSLGLPKLPGGFDGVEPGKVSEEARAKLEQSVVRMRTKLTQIADLALAAEAKSNSEHVKLGSKYLENSKAIAEIRRICKESLVDAFVPDYEWLAQIMTGDHFEPECLAKAIEAEASKRPIEYPTFYTPGWLCELAKKMAGNKDKLEPLKTRCANTPQTIVFEIVRPSGLKLSAEWEAESTGHSAQAFLYHCDKCVCHIRFLNDFQTRNVGRQVTRGALYSLASVVGHAARWRRNKKQKEGK